MIASGERDPHAAPDDRVELTPPDIEPYRQGNTSVPYMTTLDSGVAGPHAMINALMHGNEISGAIAVDHLLQRGIRPTRGRLTLAFANTTAFGMFSRERLYESRLIDEDLNRLWDDDVLSDHKRSVERLRARALRPIIDTVDHLLDLHSMQSGTRPILLCGPSPKGRDFARRLGGPAAIVADVGHADGVRTGHRAPQSPRSRWPTVSGRGRHDPPGACRAAHDRARRTRPLGGGHGPGRTPEPRRHLCRDLPRPRNHSRRACRTQR